MKQFCQKYQKPVLRVEASAYRKLEAHLWPGNVRELRHAIERAVILQEGATLRASDFMLSMKETAGNAVILENFNLEEAEKAILCKVLARHHGNISRAAEELGITRTALYRRMEKHGL